MRSIHALLVVALVGGSADALAQLSKPDRVQVRSMLNGVLYLRVDAPCQTGRHPFGVYKIPLVEVSADAVNTEQGSSLNAGWYHADSTYWGVRVNDSMVFDDIDYDESTIELELKGTGASRDGETVIKFINIRTFADFQKAFDRVFSRKPLQDEHPDWPQEIRKAIADRKLIDGMNKRQAYYVTGDPESFDAREEGGKKVEVWTLRQNKGMKMGFFMAKGGETTGLPRTIRFENEKLVGVGTGKPVIPPGEMHH